jgi:DNA repair protein RadC
MDSRFSHSPLKDINFHHIIEENKMDVNKGHRQRLKDRFISSPESLPDYEILELILFNALPRRDVKPYAKTLLSKFGGLFNLINIDETKLRSLDTPLPDSVSYQFKLIKELSKRLLKENISDKPLLNNITLVNDYLRTTIGGSSIEQFRILYLNSKNHLIADETMNSGTIDQTTVYPREILKKSIFYDAAAIIIAHNHPSGVATPSKADVMVTHQIVAACKTIDVVVHDHIIVSPKQIYSFKSEGLL